jgi:DNA-directed RNA polymerase specialized sigma24 family protein
MQKRLSIEDQYFLRDLVARCQADERNAWEKLFAINFNEIKKSIVYILKRFDRMDLIKDDVLGDIILSSYVKAKKGIHDIRDPLSVKSWLTQIAVHNTHDYLNRLNTRDNKYKRYLYKLTRSLSQPISYENNTSLGESLPAPEPVENFSQALEEILDELDQFSEQHRWAFRLKMIFYNPFGQMEIDQLAEFLEKPIELVCKQIDSLMDGLTQKAEDREVQLLDAARLTFEMEKMQYSLQTIRSQSGNQEEIDAATNEIKAKLERVQKLEFEGQQHVEPSNKEITAILGIPIEKSQNISVIVHRIRKRLIASKGFQTYIQSKIEDATAKALQ